MLVILTILMFIQINKSQNCNMSPSVGYSTIIAVNGRCVTVKCCDAIDEDYLQVSLQIPYSRISGMRRQDGTTVDLFDVSEATLWNLIDGHVVTLETSGGHRTSEIVQVSLGITDASIKTNIANWLTQNPNAVIHDVDFQTNSYGGNVARFMTIHYTEMDTN
eukprot:502651_1